VERCRILSRPYESLLELDGGSPNCGPFKQQLSLAVQKFTPFLEVSNKAPLTEKLLFLPSPSTKISSRTTLEHTQAVATPTTAAEQTANQPLWYHVEAHTTPMPHTRKLQWRDIRVPVQRAHRR